jgi:hypothetical protein
LPWSIGFSFALKLYLLCDKEGSVLGEAARRNVLLELSLDGSAGISGIGGIGREMQISSLEASLRRSLKLSLDLMKSSLDLFLKSSGVDGSE